MRYILLLYILLLLVLALGACTPTAPAPPPASTEPGFSAFCAQNPHKGTCP